MADSMLRQIQILKMIPREPDTVTAAIIKEKLEQGGLSISIRTIQRNLVELSSKFPLVAAIDEEDGISLRWSWEEKAELLNIPSMDSITALSFSLAEQIIRHMLPHQAVESLHPYFLLAHKTLKEREYSTHCSWSDKFRIISQHPSRQSSTLNANVVETLYRALLEEKQLRIRYQESSKRSMPTQEISPLGIVFMDDQAYLISATSDSQEPLALPLHQIKSAKLLKAPLQVPQGFHLDTYLEKGFPGSV